MRFLLECVGCCMMNTTSSSSEESTSPATPRAEETRSLVAPATEARLSRRRRRTSSSPRPTSADWKPSLFAISEDIPVPVAAGKPAENRNRPAEVAVKQPGSRNVKRCAPSSVRVNAHARPHEFGHNPLPIVVPAFSAAAFMF